MRGLLYLNIHLCIIQKKNDECNQTVGISWWTSAAPFFQKWVTEHEKVTAYIKDL